MAQRSGFRPLRASLRASDFQTRRLHRRAAKRPSRTEVDVGVHGTVQHVAGQLVPARRVNLSDVLELAAELGVELPERYQGRPLPGFDALELPAAEEVPRS